MMENDIEAQELENRINELYQTGKISEALDLIIASKSRFEIVAEAQYIQVPEVSNQIANGLRECINSMNPLPSPNPIPNPKSSPSQAMPAWRTKVSKILQSQGFKLALANKIASEIQEENYDLKEVMRLAHIESKKK